MKKNHVARIQAIALILLCSISGLGYSASLSQQGRDFLKDNATREEVQVTESGLQYIIQNPGNELRATKRHKVLAHYQGKHINGEVFDSTYGGDPIEFRLSQVIKGWTEGLQHIGEGGRIILFVPPRLAYGRAGKRPQIKKDETLIFIIDLIEILPRK